VSEADEKDDVESAGGEEQATPTPEKEKINDPLTRSDVEAPRRPWQPQRPSPPGGGQEGDDQA
jgi:hypothetical protein